MRFLLQFGCGHSQKINFVEATAGDTGAGDANVCGFVSERHPLPAPRAEHYNFLLLFRHIKPPCNI